MYVFLENWPQHYYMRSFFSPCNILVLKCTLPDINIAIPDFFLLVLCGV